MNLFMTEDQARYMLQPGHIVTFTKNGIDTMRVRLTEKPTYSTSMGKPVIHMRGTRLGSNGAPHRKQDTQYVVYMSMLRSVSI